MPGISQATIEKAVQDIQRNQAESEQQFKEDQATKVGEDPSRPWHPTLNPNREDTNLLWWEQRQRAARRKYLSVWDDCIEKIKARTWTTRRDIAKHYRRSNSWATCMVQLMVHQRVFTPHDLRLLLPGQYLKKKKRAS